jgi:hypothetical protein
MKNNYNELLTAVTLNDALNVFVAAKLPEYNEDKRNSIVRTLFFMIDNVLDDMKTPQI